MLTTKHLHPYQHTGISHVKTHSHCALFLDMGLGKTVTSLTVIKEFIDDLDIINALVVAPKRVAESVWSDEVENWTHLEGLKLSKIIGTEKQRKAALLVKADIYLISRDNVAWLCGLYGGLSLPFDMLVIDELSSFKNHASQRFKALKRVQPSFKRVVGLTGTPTPNGLIDLWAQIYLLDRGQRLGKNITEYRTKFFKNISRDSNYSIYEPASKEHEKKIHELIGDICLSMKAKDYLNLPDVIMNDIKIVFPEKLQKQYDDFEEEKILELVNSGEEISVLNASALSNKLLQFANGAVYDENKDWHEVHDLKLQELADIIENANGQPVLIAWTFRHDMYRLKEYLKKYKPRELDGDKDIKDWNDGKIQVLLMHPASGGHGLNLQKGGNIIVWFGQTWSLELYQQFNARLNRQGQERPVIINRLIAVNTLDTRVVRALAGKDKTQDSLMEAIKAKIKNYINKL